MTFYPERSHPLVIAHRGDSAHAPENTLAAFRLAMQNGADGVELDVSLSADGELMVCHDSTVDRTTSGKGKIADLTLAQLKDLDAGAWFGEAFTGERLPTLAEVFAALPDGLIDVELKPGALNSPLPERVAALIKQFGYESRVLITSFQPLYLKRLPHLVTGLLELPGGLGKASHTVFTTFLQPRFIVPYYKSVTIDFMAAQRQKRRGVIPWTVNDPHAIRAMRDLGVEAVITDDPLAAQQALEGA